MGRSGPARDGFFRFLSGRAFLFAWGAAALAPWPAAPVHAEEATVAAPVSLAEAVREEIADRARGDAAGFYKARQSRPLWLDSSGQLSPAAILLLREVQSAKLDGLKPGKLKAGRMKKALLRAAQGSPQALAKAELALSDSFVRYVKALRRANRSPMIYESPALAPVVPTTAAALQAAASAGPLEQYGAGMGWMHPLYAPLRRGRLRPA